MEYTCSFYLSQRLEKRSHPYRCESQRMVERNNPYRSWITEAGGVTANLICKIFAVWDPVAPEHTVVCYKLFAYFVKIMGTNLHSKTCLSILLQKA
jgi:hypothetical protein